MATKTDPWVEKMCKLVEGRKWKKTKLPYERETLCMSKGSGRRGRIKYANNTHVEVCFSEATGASKAYTISEFERLWRTI